MQDIVSYIVAQELMRRLKKRHLLLPGMFLVVSSVLLGIRIYLYFFQHIIVFWIVSAILDFVLGLLLTSTGVFLFLVNFRIDRLGFVFFSIFSLILFGIIMMLLPVISLISNISLLTLTSFKVNEASKNFLIFLLIFLILLVIYSIPAIIENFAYVFSTSQRRRYNIGTNFITYLLLSYLILAPSTSAEFSLTINLFLLLMMDFLLLFGGITLIYYAIKGINELTLRRISAFNSE